jgi:4-hydroxy-tetrahydrodipicolinate synthase
MSFHGIIPALTTPFDPDDRVDLAALHRNAELVLAAGVHGIVGTGTMGEAGSLSRQERQQVLRTICEAACGQVPVIAGISAGTPSAAIAHALEAREAGVAGFMLLPPLLYSGDYDELVAFVRSVCEAAQLPTIFYNNPEAAGYDVGAQAIVRLAGEVEQVVAVKECSGDVRRIPQILHAAEGRLAVLVGGDDWALEGLCVGAAGWISGAADVVPDVCVALHAHVRQGELAAARELYARLLPLARLDMAPKLVQYFKAALDELGRDGGPSRPPRLPLSEAEREQVRAALASLNDGPHA